MTPNSLDGAFNWASLQPALPEIYLTAAICVLLLADVFFGDRRRGLAPTLTLLILVGGAWLGMQSDQAKVTPGFNMQPVPLFAVGGKDPLYWGNDQPIFYTFIKKGLGADRTKELLRVLDWCAAPFGTKEWETREFGKEGTHFTRDSSGAPAATACTRAIARFCHARAFSGSALTTCSKRATASVGLFESAARGELVSRGRGSVTKRATRTPATIATTAMTAIRVRRGRCPAPPRVARSWLAVAVDMATSGQSDQPS